jgi:hypothetical protein
LPFVAAITMSALLTATTKSIDLTVLMENTSQMTEKKNYILKLPTKE